MAVVEAHARPDRDQAGQFHPLDRDRSRRPPGARGRGALPRAQRPDLAQGHVVRRGREGDRVPDLRDPPRPRGERRPRRAPCPRADAGRVPHRVLHQDRPRAARGIDQPVGHRLGGRTGDPAGGAPHLHDLPVHLVAGRRRRARHQAPGPARRRRVDLRRQRRDRRRRRRPGEEGAARLYGEPRRDLRDPHDLHPALAGGRARICRTWSPAPGSAATSTRRRRCRRPGRSWARKRSRSPRSSRSPRTP